MNHSNSVRGVVVQKKLSQTDEANAELYMLVIDNVKTQQIYCSLFTSVRIILPNLMNILCRLFFFKIKVFRKPDSQRHAA